MFSTPATSVLADALSLRGQGQGQVHRNRRLPDAALPARDGDDGQVLRTVRHDPLLVAAILVIG
jgi:hypothetical protein